MYYFHIKIPSSVDLVVDQLSLFQIRFGTVEICVCEYDACICACMHACVLVCACVCVHAVCV